MKGNHFTNGGIIAKEQKYTEHFKKSSRTSRPISIKPGTDHPWVKGIHFY
jgi:hypothetical protein